MYLLPIPRSMRMEQGAFELNLYTKIVLDWELSELARTGAKQLCEEIAVCGLRVDITCGAARSGDVFLTVQPGGKAQGYTLTITPEQVTVCGNDAAGLLHGVQTLRQIIRQSGWTLPALIIEDAPSIPARGFYHDVTRGRTPTLEFLKQLADTACFYKLNQLQLYVEHTYLFRDLTEMWRVVEPLSAEEIMEYDAYCAARGIELVPSLSCFGHLLELLRTKSYSDLCELPDARSYASAMHNRMAHHTLNPSDPRSFELVKQMISEFMPLFRSRQFNICCDETFDLGKGKSQEKMDKLGEGEVYISFVEKVCQYVVELGRRPMFWGDIILRSPEMLKRLPEGTICLNWGYSPVQTEDSTRTLAQSGAIQYVCPGVIGWNQWTNRLHDGYDNITRMAQYARRYQAIGLLNTDWGDYGHVNDPRQSFPGLAYGAQFSWSDEALGFEDINKALSLLQYGDQSGSVLAQLALMEGCDVYNWRMLVQNKEYRCGELAQINARGSFDNADASLIPEKNAQLDAAMAGLKACCLQMNPEQRSMIECWLVAGEAIKLWNLAGAAVHAEQKNAELACALERWLERYERVWRTVSKESELWRVRSMVGWYADQLR